MFTYAEGLRHGGYIVTVQTDSAHYETAIDIMDDEGTVNLDERVWNPGAKKGGLVLLCSIPRSLEQQKEDEKYRGDQEDEGTHVPGTPTALADPLSPCGSTNQLQRGLIVRATR